MKQRRPKRRKPFRQPTKRLPSKKGMAPEEGLLALREAAAQKKKVEQHKEMLSRTEVLDWLIANLPEGGPGHNRQPITQDDVREIKKAVAALKALPVVPRTQIRIGPRTLHGY